MGLRENILDAAVELFSESGFNKVSVAAICSKSGSSKGGFYHHFPSKEALIEAIVLEYVSDLEKDLVHMQKDPSLEVIEGIGLVIDKVNEYKKNQMTSWPSMRRMLTFEGNHIIIQSMVEAFSKLTTSTYQAFIERGIAEGIIHVSYIEPMAKLITREINNLYGIIGKIIMSEDEEARKTFVETARFTEEFLNRQLGLKDRKLGIDKKVIDYLEYVMKSKPI